MRSQLIHGRGQENDNTRTQKHLAPCNASRFKTTKGTSLNASSFKDTGSGFAETHEVSAVAGSDAWLPCNVTHSNASDDEDRPVALILWYKDNSSTPVYTVDARSGTLLQGARHFPGEDEVAARLSFDAGQQPAVLRVARVEAEDAGVYRCRVDYRQARTENTWSTLRVIGKKPLRPMIV
ncbi:hypothetical protein HPB48_003230 [Haemaphysalis longicornis]|uniref:Ig-like domain-containing protein n=1 Tax=Haemaphysalis longicornis TaxID=44386 RepID=A0A9J6FX33_HAELO|nr:hypothetical protein HPB48_003230 [Haemaphysalis longicornis]